MHANGDRLERSLVELGARIAYPREPDLAAAVARRIEAEPAPRLRRSAPGWRRRGLALGIALALLATGAALASYLGVRGVRITVGPSPTLGPGVGSSLDLGARVTLARARAEVTFPVRVPAALGDPDEAYVGVGVAGGQVTLLYRPRPGLPEAGGTGAGLLLTEFRAKVARDLLGKVVSSPRQIQDVPVNGAPALWIEGAHLVFYLDAEGEVIEETVRLSANVLLWQIGDVTLRLESALPKERAIRIAESVR